MSDVGQPVVLAFALRSPTRKHGSDGDRVVASFVHQPGTPEGWRSSCSTASPVCRRLAVGLREAFSPLPCALVLCVRGLALDRAFFVLAGRAHDGGGLTCTTRHFAQCPGRTAGGRPAGLRAAHRVCHGPRTRLHGRRVGRCWTHDGLSDGEARGRPGRRRLGYGLAAHTRRRRCALGTRKRTRLWVAICTRGQALGHAEWDGAQGPERRVDRARPRARRYERLGRPPGWVTRRSPRRPSCTSRRTRRYWPLFPDVSNEDVRVARCALAGGSR